MTMILIGTILAGTDMRTMITGLTLKFSFIRLVIIPLIVFVGCMAVRIGHIPMGVCVVLAAMPAGSTTAILAAQYKCGEEFAGKCVVLTTIFSMIAIPFWCMATLWVMGFS